MLTVDAHLHLWNLDRVHYHWLTADDPLLYRNYLPQDVYPHLKAAGIDAAVVVEAANSPAEIPYFIELCEQNPWIAGFVSWMPSPEQLDEGLNSYHKGVRLPVIRSFTEPNLPESFVDNHLTVDLMLEPAFYPQALSFIQKYPGITFVLNHFAGASITPGAHHTWMEQLRPLAESPNTVMKVAGYLTAAQPQPLVVDTLQGYLEDAVQLFGASRLLFGSDWPICTRVGSYEAAVDILRQAMYPLSAKEQASIMGMTAQRVYRLPV